MSTKHAAGGNARRKSDSQAKTTKVKFRIPREDAGEKDVAFSAYAFDANGRLLDAQPVKKDEVALDLPEEEHSHVRLFFAPTTREADEPPTLGAMARMRAYEASWEMEKGKTQYELKPVPKALWPKWRLCSCRVRGRVVKPVTHAGVTMDLPVCKARVHICEVDRWRILVPRLPDELIDRIRWELLKDIKVGPWPPIRIPPRPGPDPPPDLDEAFRFDTSVVNPTPEAIAKMQPLRLEKQEAFEAHAGAHDAPRIAKASFEGLGVESFNPFSAQTMVQLSSNSLQIVREAILANPRIIWPYFCKWWWMRHWLHCDEVRVVDTDDQGRFDVTIWHPCDDEPDLYFWVEYCIGGTWTTVYEPPLACATHWNFDCGDEVTLRITDPRVPACGPLQQLPGAVVAVLTVGNGVNVNQVGQSGTGEGLTPGGAPFGGSLEPHVIFGDGLPAAGVAYWRWSYRRVGTSAWTALDKQVVRHYLDATNPSAPSIQMEVLGPKTVGSGPSAVTNLFALQTPLSPLGTAWTPQVDARENTASGFFLSHTLNSGNAALGAGKYELRLELLDAAGQSMNLGNSGIKVFVPVASANAPFGPTTPALVNADDGYHVRSEFDPAVGAARSTFRMVLHVDNNVCEGELLPVEVNGQQADDCGFLHYHHFGGIPLSSARIQYRALHRNGFARYDFGIYRGSSGAVAGVGVTDALVTTTPVGPPPYQRVDALTGRFEANVPVSTLLGHCPRAAFAETLYVRALATDGWGRLSYLDASPTPKAFALAPQP